MTRFARRTFLGAAVASTAGWTSNRGAASAAARHAEPASVRYCLNTSTVRGQKLTLPEEVDLAAEAGYDGIEPWIGEIETFRASGRPLSDLRKQIADRGLRVESAIGFAQWIVNDDDARRKGLEQLKRDMDAVQQIGGALIAAPPVGLHQADAPRVDLLAAAERYHAALEIGREIGVTPQAEVWGFSPNLSRLGETVFVAIESGHPDACILPDVYHLFRGGSPFEGLGLLSATSIHCFHFNDYPAHPSREQQTDALRVYPGDGAAPWDTILSALRQSGFAGAVSLELFNPGYWAEDPKLVARTGLEKMKAVFARHGAAETTTLPTG